MRSTAVLGLTQLAVHVPGVKRPGRETENLPFRAEAIMVELYLHSLHRTDGLALS
jgi:hypothetical protein